MKEAKEDCLSFTVHPRRLKFRLTKKQLSGDTMIDESVTYEPTCHTEQQILILSTTCVSECLNCKLQ